MLKPRFLVCSWIGLVDWIGDDMSQLKLIEYQTMHIWLIPSPVDEQTQNLTFSIPLHK